MIAQIEMPFTVQINLQNFRMKTAIYASSLESKKTAIIYGGWGGCHGRNSNNKNPTPIRYAVSG